MTYHADWSTPEATFDELVGKTFTRFDISPNKERVEIVCTDGSIYVMYHSQDCCESVAIESITGEVADLIGSPILVAEESSSNKDPEDRQASSADRWCESFTWTFYKLATVKGWVDLRWLGESNGYYSESVSLARVAPALSTQKKRPDRMREGPTPVRLTTQTSSNAPGRKGRGRRNRG
jgi:hypothetical protein